MASVGLGVRPPGLAFRFDHSMRLYLVLQYPYSFFSFDPPELGQQHRVVDVDSAFVSWRALAPTEYQGGTYFEREMFFLERIDTALVVITATVNLAATYANPDDTVLVWGTEIGMPDIELRGAGLATPTSVSPTTWGQIKHDGLKRIKKRSQGN